ncbi:Cytohesin 1, 2, 3, 4 [Paramicrosporidium saccamoebae]|uniref:Cytohesin 1, 2, 3, 4 n=1 Tax=Paramicrosporidium saccamoebae TaxID=1246581 RepID=A0A2H9TNC8_9FUNG|nr:Cytohesin 1, 2, 3, 4 [Paramicrosporidium saccamoebae]
MLWKKSDRFHSWNRRWCVIVNGCLYYFYSHQDKSPRGVIPLEDLTVRPLDRRGKFRFEITADDSLQGGSWLDGSIQAQSTAGSLGTVVSVGSMRSVKSNASSQSFLFGRGDVLPLIKSAKYVNGQLVEGRRDRYVFQCASEAERDRWVAVLSSRMKYRPVSISLSESQLDMGDTVNM